MPLVQVDDTTDDAFELTAEEEEAFAELMAAESPPGFRSLPTNETPHRLVPDIDDAVSSYAPGTTTAASSPLLAPRLVSEVGSPHRADASSVGEVLDTITEKDLDFDLAELDSSVAVTEATSRPTRAPLSVCVSPLLAERDVERS